jgi:hypothetical protein
MDFCGLCGSPLLEGETICRDCGASGYRERPPKDTGQSHAVFLARVCNGCNGVVGVSCVCDDGEPEREFPRS